MYKSAILKKIYNPRKGTTLMLALVFTCVFTLVAVVLVSLVTSQLKLGRKKVASNFALQIAEAGVNYYRWHLAHAPSDFTDGTLSPGPYVHSYFDPYGSEIGKFSLEITAPSECSPTIIIKSTGFLNSHPETKRKVEVKYGKSSLATFSFLTNSNVWFGEDEELSGPVHSNGGIRMDGEIDSRTTSAKETYICGPEHGCNNQEKPGIWGTGERQDLWDFPSPGVDFNLITMGLVELKEKAQASGIYLPSSGLGYHLRFKNNGTFDLYQVKKLKNPIWGYDGKTWVKESNDIQKETFLKNYTLPQACSIIFIEDNIWVDGEVNGKVTLVAARLPDIPSNNAKIIINGNINYKVKDGSSVLALIAQKDVLVPLYSAPNQLEINAVLFAQKGHAFRYYYPSNYSPYHLRSKIELYGAIITNTIWTWSWVNSSGTVISGYEETETIYDPHLNYNPPPGFPTYGEYNFLEWEEVTEKE